MLLNLSIELDFILVVPNSQHSYVSNLIEAVDSLVLMQQPLSSKGQALKNVIVFLLTKGLHSNKMNNCRSDFEPCLYI